MVVVTFEYGDDFVVVMGPRVVGGMGVSSPCIKWMNRFCVMMDGAPFGGMVACMHRLEVKDQEGVDNAWFCVPSVSKVDGHAVLLMFVSGCDAMLPSFDRKVLASWLGRGGCRGGRASTQVWVVVRFQDGSVLTQRSGMSPTCEPTGVDQRSGMFPAHGGGVIVVVPLDNGRGC